MGRFFGGYYWPPVQPRSPRRSESSGCARLTLEPLEDRCLLSFTPLGPEFLVAGSFSSSNFFPAVTVDPTGNIVIGWQSFGASSEESGILLQQYRGDGSPAGSPFSATSPGSIFQSHATVAAADNGDFVVAWQQLGDIYAVQFDANGVAKGSVIPISVGNRFDVTPEVAIDADGDFVVAWDATGGTTEGIYARRYAANGSALGSEFRVDFGQRPQVTDPAIAMDASGDFIITWTGFSGGNVAGLTAAGIYARRYAADGTANDDGVLVSDALADRVSKSSVAMDANGNFVIAWQATRLGSSYDIFAKRFDASGVAVAPTFRVNSGTEGVQQNVSAAMNAVGQILFAWDGESEQGTQTVVGRRYDPSGSPLGDEFVVSATIDLGLSPDADIDDEGDFVIAWSSANGAILARIYWEDQLPTTTGIPGFSADEDTVLEATLDLTAYFDDREDGPGGLTYQILAVDDGTGLLGTLTLSDGLLNATWSENANGAVRITIRATDSAGQSVDSVFVLAVNPVNDAATLSLPGSQQTTAGALLAIPAVVVNDIDVGNGLLSVTLTAAGGTLNIGNASGVQFLLGDGFQDKVVTFVGSLAAINSALSSLQFQAGGAEDPAGFVTIEVNDSVDGDTGLMTFGQVDIAIAAAIITPPPPDPEPPVNPGTPGSPNPPPNTGTPLVFQPFLINTIYVSPTPVPALAGQNFGTILSSSDLGLFGFGGNGPQSITAGRTRDGRSTASGQSQFLQAGDGAAYVDSGDDKAGWELASQLAVSQMGQGTVSVEMQRASAAGDAERLVDFWEGPAGMLNSALAGSDDNVPLIESLLAEPAGKSTTQLPLPLTDLLASILIDGARSATVTDLLAAASTAQSTLATDLALSGTPASSVEEESAKSPALSNRRSGTGSELEWPYAVILVGAAIGLVGTAVASRRLTMRQIPST